MAASTKTGSGSRRRGRGRRAKQTPVFDIVGKRRWFYDFSTLITIPGLIFLLLTPLSGGNIGLQFSIDFTGGTVWRVHFLDTMPTPAQVREVLTEKGLEGQVRLTA